MKMRRWISRRWRGNYLGSITGCWAARSACAGGVGRVVGLGVAETGR